MKGFGGSPDIYDKVVNAMTRDIEKITNERTEIVVIPFQDTDYCEIWREPATQAGKKILVDKIKSYKNDKITSTNIARPLKYVIDHVLTEDKIDILKLMTDGKTSASSKPELQYILSHWCELAALKKDAYGYYILLTPEAQDSDIIKILHEACRFETIETTDIDEIVSIACIQTVKFNIRDDFDKAAVVQLIPEDGTTIPQGYAIHITASPNPYFDLNEEVTVTGNKVVFKPRFKMSKQELIATLPQEPNEIIELIIAPANQAKYPLVRLIDQRCFMELINKPEKTLRIDVR